MPPISMMRSARLSRPVVSVSKMISRIPEISLGNPRFQVGDDLKHSFPRRRDTVTGIDQIIGPPPFFGVRRLAGENHLEFFLGHVFARKHPLALNLWISADDDDYIHPCLGAGFEK